MLWLEFGRMLRDGIEGGGGFRLDVMWQGDGNWKSRY